MTDFEQCPYLDRDDPRCGQVLRLDRINDAFRLCMGGFPQCPIYRIMDRSRKGYLGVRRFAATAKSA